MTNLEKFYNETIKKNLKSEFNYQNDFQIPKIKKVTINMGLGLAKDSDEVLKNAISILSQISGQKPRVNKAKKSIAGFKLRAGQIVGLSITLRGARMYDFIERFVNIALPRIRDFRGVNDKSFDQQGNFSIGINDHTIFPEIKFDGVKESLSMQINFSTSSTTTESARRLFELLGVPFSRKTDSAKIKTGVTNG